MKYLIRLSPEITIKSKPVRKRCVKLLQNNIKKHFNYYGLTVHISGTWDIIIVEYKKNIDIEAKKTINKQIISILGSIPGIAHFMEVMSYSLDDCISQEEIFDTIFKKTLDIHGKNIKGKSFVVRTKRSGLHGFNSTDVERYVGGGLLKYGKECSVKLKNPDVTIRLEVRDKTFHVIKQQITGINGYPIGFQEKIVSLISGGFDSGVSTYSMMKRGCEVDYLFFNLGGNAHELGVKQVSYYLWKNFSISYKKARFICVPFEEIIEKLLTNVHHKFRGIILKRYMLKVASMVSHNNYYAVVKGDSLGQVSSQTLKNMHVIDKASENLVLRPLIAFNKQEIIDISQKIGTYHFACNMPEYCGAVSDKPATGAKLEDILEEEKDIDESILKKAFENRKIDFVKDMLESDFTSGENSNLEVISEIATDSIVIDIREQEKILKNKLTLKNIQILEIPFFKINSEFAKLEQSKEYLLYCDKGVLSELHGLYLQEKGFTNIAIFRPKK